MRNQYKIISKEESFLINKQVMYIVCMLTNQNRKFTDFLDPAKGRKKQLKNN